MPQSWWNRRKRGEMIITRQRRRRIKKSSCRPWKKNVYVQPVRCSNQIPPLLLLLLLLLRCKLHLNILTEKWGPRENAQRRGTAWNSIFFSLFFFFFGKLSRLVTRKAAQNVFLWCHIIIQFNENWERGGAASSVWRELKRRWRRCRSAGWICILIDSTRGDWKVEPNWAEWRKQPQKKKATDVVTIISRALTIRRMSKRCTSTTEIRVGTIDI